MRFDSHMLGDEVIFCRGGILLITEPTPGDLVMGDTCATLSTGHLRIFHEQRTPCMMEATFQWVFKLQALHWHIIERVDGKLSGDGWEEKDGSTYTESVSIRNPYNGCIQGITIWHMWFPTVISTMLW